MTIKKQNKKKNVSAGKVMAIGATVAALGAGAYYLLGPNGKINQKKAVVWMSKMKKEVEKKMATAKNVTEKAYHDTVDNLAQNYAKQYKEYAPEIIAFGQLLKSEWKNTKKNVKVTSKESKKSVKKITKVAKKIVNKKRV